MKEKLFQKILGDFRKGKTPEEIFSSISFQERLFLIHEKNIIQKIFFPFWRSCLQLQFNHHDIKLKEAIKRYSIEDQILEFQKQIAIVEINKITKEKILDLIDNHLKMKIYENLFPEKLEKRLCVYYQLSENKTLELFIQSNHKIIITIEEGFGCKIFYPGNLLTYWRQSYSRYLPLELIENKTNKLIKDLKCSI
jgi:hypothetical protein